MMIKGHILPGKNNQLKKLLVADKIDKKELTHHPPKIKPPILAFVQTLIK
jgi:hypothetical protein